MSGLRFRSWRTTHTPAEARLGSRELNGLQAHAILHHDADPVAVLEWSVRDLARRHAQTPHEHFHPARVTWNTITLR